MAGLGAGLALYVLSGFGDLLQVSLVMAPFGASCVLIFLLPASPLSQPRNVIGGHMLSSLTGLLALSLYKEIGVAEAHISINIFMSVAVGFAISLMGVLKVVHPPAGADPIVIFISQPGFDFLVLPVLCGSVFLVLAGKIQQHFINRLNKSGEIQ